MNEESAAAGSSRASRGKRWLMMSLLLIAGAIFYRGWQITRQGRTLAELESRGAEVMLANPEYAARIVPERYLPHDIQRMSYQDVCFFSHGITLSDSDLYRLAEIRNLSVLNIQGKTITDSSLPALKRMRHLYGLALLDTQLTDEGLGQLALLPKLDRLALQGPRITDASLSQLKSLPRLEYLNLDKTSVTDTCLGQLSKMTGLRELDLKQTKVTAAGIAKLKLALPRTAISGP